MCKQIKWKENRKTPVILLPTLNPKHLSKFHNSTNLSDDRKFYSIRNINYLMIAEDWCFDLYDRKGQNK